MSKQPPTLFTQRILIHKEKVAWVKWLLEGYDGLGICSATESPDELLLISTDSQRQQLTEFIADNQLQLCPKETGQ